MEFTQINNLDNDIYHNSDKYKDYWSSSNIKNYKKTPKEAYYQKFVAENKQTDAMRLGTLIHDFLESKHNKGAKFPYNEFEPPINEKTGKTYGKTTKAYIEVLQRVENPILESELSLIKSVYNELMNSQYRSYVIDFLTSGTPEASFFVETESGLKYKYRPDVLTDTAIYDYKSINKNDWSVSKINAKIVNLGYDISASMYQYFEFKRTGIWKPFILVWLMKEPPFDVLITDISGYCYEQIGTTILRHAGAVMFENLLKQHEACMSANSWVGLANKFEENKGLRIPKLSASYWHTGEYNEYVL